jgi:hypothetical protein
MRSSRNTQHTTQYTHLPRTGAMVTHETKKRKPSSDDDGGLESKSYKISMREFNDLMTSFFHEDNNTAEDLEVLFKGTDKAGEKQCACIDDQIEEIMEDSIDPAELVDAAEVVLRFRKPSEISTCGMAALRVCFNKRRMLTIEDVVRYTDLVFKYTNPDKFLSDLVRWKVDQRYNIEQEEGDETTTRDSVIREEIGNIMSE